MLEGCPSGIASRVVIQVGYKDDVASTVHVLHVAPGVTIQSMQPVDELAYARSGDSWLIESTSASPVSFVLDARGVLITCTVALGVTCEVPDSLSTVGAVIG